MTSHPETKTTLNFYNENSKKYFDRTVVINMQHSYEKFLKHMPSGGKILDVGCGSGRDLKFFKECGFDVVGMDASEEMVKLSSEYSREKTLLLNFDQIDFYEEFDGIWCSASLLHIPSEQLLSIMEKILKALKPNGIWFFSFISGEFEGYRDGRYFHYMTRDKLGKYLKVLDGIEVLDIFEVASYDAQRDTRWVHCIARRNQEREKPCIFCNRESTFSSIIAESEHSYAVLDNYPVNPGHILIISKGHYEHWFKAPREVQVDIIDFMERLKGWLDEKHAPDGYNVGFNCSKYSGQTIPHLHVHLIPRYKGDCINPEGGIRGVIETKKKYRLATTGL